ncbi:hypothetical protein DAPPUDRAFT_232204 [Daphnia pulex]|uniref:Uncharacterized protein n=1 Tax=Daphnia pulex TaxID=6669 RepID=E9FS36_DAPPU|nr:hypothetical protein DAPPUDRAFT_232204 [Daphnia pulex]|eukprot:EFX89965.1 hypothetical protein DAPPUDRAFT_232204 [Daphnia pulex]
MIVKEEEEERQKGIPTTIVEKDQTENAIDSCPSVEFNSISLRLMLMMQQITGGLQHLESCCCLQGLFAYTMALIEKSTIRAAVQLPYLDSLRTLGQCVKLEEELLPQWLVPVGKMVFKLSRSDPANEVEPSAYRESQRQKKYYNFEESRPPFSIHSPFNVDFLLYFPPAGFRRHSVPAVDEICNKKAVSKERKKGEIWKRKSSVGLSWAPIVGPVDGLSPPNPPHTLGACYVNGDNYVCNDCGTAGDISTLAAGNKGVVKTGKGGMTRCPQARPAPPGNREKQQTTTKAGDTRTIEPTKHLNMYTPSTGHETALASNLRREETPSRPTAHADQQS